MLYYSLAGLILFTLTHKFEDFTNVAGLPFHLCNTALYITPICLIFRAKKVFYFTYFINVLGAFLAIAMPDYNLEGLNGSVLMSDTLLFFRSHYHKAKVGGLLIGIVHEHRISPKKHRLPVVDGQDKDHVVIAIQG